MKEEDTQNITIDNCLPDRKELSIFCCFSEQCTSEFQERRLPKAEFLSLDHLRLHQSDNFA